MDKILKRQNVRFFTSHVQVIELLHVPRALILYRRRRFINHLLTYLLNKTKLPKMVFEIQTLKFQRIDFVKHGVFSHAAIGLWS